MGLHSIQIDVLNRILQEKEAPTIIEFGSGNSTQFFSDLDPARIFSMDSIDHDKRYAWKGTDSRIRLSICPLKQRSQLEFDRALISGNVAEGPEGEFVEGEISFRTPRLFYDLSTVELPNSVDLAVIDGPNGNGRMLAIPALRPMLASGSHVFIDDVHHFAFEDVLSRFFSFEVVARLISPKIHPLFGFGVYKIISSR